MKILLIEDEKELAESIISYLVKNQKFNCDHAENADRAKELIALYKYDCLIVDIGLPDGSGLDIIREAKEDKNKAGIIIISARNSIDDRIEGLDIGADDYLTKPFHLSELNARIHSLMRRLKSDGESLIRINEIEIDPRSRSIKISGKPLNLTKSEYDLLFYFVTNKNQVLSKSSIAEHLVGEYVDVMGSLDFIYLHIKNLRKKLIKSGCADYISSVYGVGYKFDIE